MHHATALLCRIMQAIFDAMAPIAPHTLFVLVANPVDILSTIAQRLSGLSARCALLHLSTIA